MIHSLKNNTADIVEFASITILPNNHFTFYDDSTQVTTKLENIKASLVDTMGLGVYLGNNAISYCVDYVASTSTALFQLLDTLDSLVQLSEVPDYKRPQLDNGIINFVVDGGGNEIVANVLDHVMVPYPFRIMRWTFDSDHIGSGTLDVVASEYGIPSALETITNGSYIEVNGMAGFGEVISWAKRDFQANTRIGFNILASSIHKKLRVQLHIKKIADSRRKFVSRIGDFDIMNDTPGATTLSLTWSVSANAIVYRVYRQENDNVPILVTATSSLTFNDTGLNASSRYTYKIVPMDNQINAGTAKFYTLPANR